MWPHLLILTAFGCPHQSPPKILQHDELPYCPTEDGRQAERMRPEKTVVTTQPDEAQVHPEDCNPPCTVKYAVVEGQFLLDFEACTEEPFKTEVEIRVREAIARDQWDLEFEDGKTTGDITFSVGCGSPTDNPD